MEEEEQPPLPDPQGITIPAEVSCRRELGNSFDGLELQSWLALVCSPRKMGHIFPELSGPGEDSC